MHDTIDSFFKLILEYAVTGVEIVGAIIILFYTIRALVCLLQKRHDCSRSMLTTGITTGLTFLLASEVLETIIAPNWSALGMTCAILLIRAGMTLLVHWENKLEHKDTDTEK